MILAYKKTLGKFTKVLGFEKPPPPPWEKFPKNPVFFLAASLIGLFVIIPDGGGEALEHVGICKLLTLAFSIQID